MKTYRVVFVDNAGSFAAAALAESCNGNWRNTVQRFDGEHDLAFIDVPAGNAEHLEQMLDADDNVISYKDVS